MSEEEYVPANSAEEKALERGWKPLSMYDGDPDTFVDAKEFLGRGELMDQISKANKRNKALEKELDRVVQWMSTQEQRAIEEARAQLMAEKAEALRDGDAYKAVQVDEELRNLNQKPIQPTANKQTEFHEYEEEWKKNHKWYGTNDAMTGAALQYARKYVENNGDVTPEALFSHVTKKIKEDFPQQFKNPRREGNGDIAPSSTSGGSSSGRGVSLTAEQKRVADRFIAQGLFKNYSEYAAKLAEI